jgi:hypothetical protein
MTTTPLRLQLTHQFSERVVLMLISIERRVARPSHQFTERRVTGKIRSQHKGVDKIPDQALDLETVSICDGGSYHDIGLPRVSMEQGLERRHMVMNNVTFSC